MSETIYEKLDKKIEELKSILKKSSTYNLCGTVAEELGMTTSPHDNIYERTQLSSPARQYLYMLGLLMSTEFVETEEQTADKENIDYIKKLLNEVLDIHAELFFPHEDKLSDKEWMEASRVSMPVFLNYFNTNPLVYDEQIIERINEWFGPFDDYLIKDYGLSVLDLVGIYKFIQSKLQERLDRLLYLNSKITEEILKSSEGHFEKQDFRNSLTQAFKHEMDNLNQIEIKEIENKFGRRKCELFIDKYSLERQERNFKYYTSNNPFESSPIWKMSNESLFIPFPKQILHAIQIQLSSFLETSKYSAQYYRNRDKQTENKTLEILKQFFGKKAKYYSSLFEDEKSTNEHDIVVLYKKNILIIEVKATKVKEPFRDPAKAYTRLKRDFKSDGGIQKAFDQALNLKKLILSQESTPLFDKKGEQVTEISKDKFDNIYCLAITAEDFGVLSINLSYFLEKPSDEPYGWSCNLNDFQTALDGIAYLNHPPETLLQYLNDRSMYHENIFASDELEILGYFLKNGSLGRRIKDKDDVLVFDPNASDLFDAIYFEKHNYYPDSVPKDVFYKNDNPNENRRKKGKKRKMRKQQSRRSRKKNRK